MNNWLIFLLKSTFALSVLYLVFRYLMRKEALFAVNRALLLLAIIASIVIPLTHVPALTINTIESTPLNNHADNSFPATIGLTPGTAHSSTPADVSKELPVTDLVYKAILPVYLAGVFISLLKLLSSFASVMLLFRKSRKLSFNGIQLMLLDGDIQAFSFRRKILMSQHDYETHFDSIFTHEMAHIRHGHFYDLMLTEFLKIVYWFNPFVYLLNKDLKEIHEFQADQHTLHSGIDATKYQMLIIQKSVGHQSFALANSFNHCQIKKRIVMMNKSKITKAWRWKVATFLPLLMLLLMAFGNKDEVSPAKLKSTVLPSSGSIATTGIQAKQQIEIRKDGNYIDNKKSSIEEIVKKGQEWNKAGNDWIHLQIEESVPYSRIDEVRLALQNGEVHFVTQTKGNSDDVVYFMGDVSRLAELKQGTWADWLKSHLQNELEAKSTEHTMQIAFIIGKDGKVRDAHIVKGSENRDIDAIYEKMLSQIPEWRPAMRGDDKVSVYYNLSFGVKKHVSTN